jgi:hypothetical protein
MTNLLPLYLLDYLEDVHHDQIYPACPVQILTGYPSYVRLVAYGTDFFDTLKVMPEAGRQTFGVSRICYRVMVTDIKEGINDVFNKYHHPFDSAPVLFQDGVLRFRENQPILKSFDQLDGLPPLAPEYLYMQFIN